MARLIATQRAPYTASSPKTRGDRNASLSPRNFNGSFDQLILDALMEAKDAEIAFFARLSLGHELAAG